MEKISNFLKQSSMKMEYQILGKNLQLIFVEKSSSFMYVNLDKFEKKIDGLAKVVDQWLQMIKKLGKARLGRLFGNLSFGYENIMITPDVISITVIVEIGDPDTEYAKEFLNELEKKGFKKA